MSEYQALTRLLGAATAHARLEARSRGLPDGSCMDAEGYVGNCRVVGGDCVIRIAPDGTVTV